MCHHTTADFNLSIPTADLKPLFKTRPFLHARAIVFDWLIIIATILLCIQFFNPATYFLAVLIIGARMHALAILMHDATHYRFLKNRKWNDMLTNLLTMYWLFTSIEQYRNNHMAHHRHLNSEHDPDWVAKLGESKFTFPKTNTEFITTVLSYLFMYTGLMDALGFLKRFSAQADKKKGKSSINYVQIGFYLVLFTVLTIAGWWAYFLLFWIVPYLSALFMFQYIRSVAEHFGDLAYENELNGSRSIRPKGLEKFFLPPHNVGYHLEHHLYPAVPFYNLPQLHELLMKDPTFKAQAHLTEGYLSGLMGELGGEKVQVRKQGGELMGLND